MPKYVEITEDEAWAIDHTIRHTYSEGPSNVGKGLLLKVMTLILEFEERRDQPLAPQTLPLALTEDECWAIDHQIRCDLTVNNKPVGRSILLKVFRALTEFANERDAESGVEQLGSLADMLRAPAEEQLGGSDPGGSGPGQPAPRGGRGNNAPPAPDSPDERNPHDRHPRPDDGAPGPLPRGK